MNLTYNVYYVDVRNVSHFTGRNSYNILLMMYNCTGAMHNINELAYVWMTNTAVFTTIQTKAILTILNTVLKHNCFVVLWI